MEKTIIVQTIVKETKVKDFLKLAKVMIGKSISERGCLSYKLSKDLSKNNEFFFYEKYENESAVEIHNSSEHFKKFINLVTPLLMKEPTIDIF